MWKEEMTAAQFLGFPSGGLEEVAGDIEKVREIVRRGVSEGEAVARVAAWWEGEARSHGITLNTRLGTLSDVLRRYLDGPGVCASCGSAVAMLHLCALCEAGAIGCD